MIITLFGVGREFTGTLEKHESGGYLFSPSDPDLWRDPTAFWAIVRAAGVFSEVPPGRRRFVVNDYQDTSQAKVLLLEDSPRPR